MAINGKHTGAFARSRYGLPNFAESPKFARGAANHEVSFYIDALVGYGPNYRLTDYMSAPFPPNNQFGGYEIYNVLYPKFIVTPTNALSNGADQALILQAPQYQSHREIRYVGSTYLAGKYSMQAIVGTDAYDTTQSYQAYYPVLSYEARLIAMDTNEVKVVSPKDMKLGYDVLPVGVSNPVNLYGANGIAAYYGWQFDVDTRLVFGRPVSFYVEESSFMLYGREYRFLGQSLPP